MSSVYCSVLQVHYHSLQHLPNTVISYKSVLQWKEQPHLSCTCSHFLQSLLEFRKKHTLCRFTHFSVCFQHSGMEHWDQAGHLWEPSISSQCWSLSHCAVLEHKWQRLCFCWEVSEWCRLAFCKPSVSLVQLMNTDFTLGGLAKN